jgi:hypothetical protein
MKRAVWMTLLVMACGHSEPFVTADQEIEGPFAAGAPLRLTYSPLTDVGMGISADGQWLTYQFERGTPDRDRCAAILPASGGQRQAELCLLVTGEAGQSDGLANAMLRPDGVVFFTRHSGFIGNLTSDSAGFYYTRADTTSPHVKLFNLLAQPAGATRVWASIMSPVWVGDNEMLVMAVRHHLTNVNACIPTECGPPYINVPRDGDRTAFRDTLAFGVEFARLRIEGTSVTITPVAPVEEAIAWSHDASTGLLHYVVQRTEASDWDVYHESVADTLMAMPATGGPTTALYGTPQAGSNHLLERLHGVASGHGRVFVSRSWRAPGNAPLPVVPKPTPLESDIVEVMPDGSVRVIAPAVTWHWNNLRLSPDGKYLYAEGLERGGGNLYRITLP